MPCSDSNFQWPPDIQEEDRLRQKLTEAVDQVQFLTRQLCQIYKRVETGHPNFLDHWPDAKIWWMQHKAQDAAKEPKPE